MHGCWKRGTFNMQLFYVQNSRLVLQSLQSYAAFTSLRIIHLTSVSLTSLYAQAPNYMAVLLLLNDI